ncbi:MAG: PQQ-binding-like beta-propeller repeat protein [Xanthomonadales bacterium]|nr:PQQ-binding-like beta-propeller repeat protein [Xanthomonadales bacterium]
MRHWVILLAGVAISLNTAAQVTTGQAWVQRVDGAIMGGVSVDDRHVYAGGEHGMVHAFARDAGAEAWRYDAGAPIASASAVDDRRVYFHARDGVVHAVDRLTGTRVWTFQTGGEQRWDYWDYYTSTPAVDDRQVYFGSGDHHVYALDKRSGELRWKLRTGNIVHGEPIISGEKILVGGFDGVFRAIDRGNGRELWTFKTVGNSYFRNGELPGTATAHDGLVYFGGRDYNLYAVLEDTGTGAWNERTPSWIVGQPLVFGDHVIVVNSDYATVISYHAKTGAENWRVSNRHNMFAGAQPLGEAHVAIASLDGSIIAIHIEDGTVSARFETRRSRARRADFFTDEGRLDYTGITSLDDLAGLYERQLQQMDGIPGRIAVEGNRAWYATAGGEVGAVDFEGIVPSPGPDHEKGPE